MTIKVTVPNTSSDSLTFGSANTPTAAQVIGIDSGSSNGQLAFNTTASGTSTERMRIDASGNVGVGTSSPSYKLDVNASSFIAASVSTSYSGAGNIRIADASTTSASAPYIGSVGNNLTFGRLGTAEYARIDSSGNLLVGTTNTSETAGIGVKNIASGAVYTVSANSTGASEGFAMYSTGATAYRFYCTWAGQIYATSTSITGISDQRLKENIRDLDDGLDVVMALKPRKFDWKEGKGANIKNARGFIAQEFETVLPDLIEEWKDPAPKGEEPYKAVNANLIPTLVKAIQELKAEVDALKAQVEAK